MLRTGICQNDDEAVNEVEIFWLRSPGSVASKIHIVLLVSAKPNVP